MSDAPAWWGNAEEGLDGGPFVGQQIFTGTGTGAQVDARVALVSAYSIQVKGVGAGATSWTVLLEVSLNGTDYSTVLTHQTSTSDGVIISATGVPARFFRAHCTGLSLGSATGLQVTIVGV